MALSVTIVDDKPSVSEGPFVSSVNGPSHTVSERRVLSHRSHQEMTYHLSPHARDTSVVLDSLSSLLIRYKSFVTPLTLYPNMDSYTWDLGLIVLSIGSIVNTTNTLNTVKSLDIEKTFCSHYCYG